MVDAVHAFLCVLDKASVGFDKGALEILDVVNEVFVSIWWDLLTVSGYFFAYTQNLVYVWSELIPGKQEGVSKQRNDVNLH